MLREDPTLPGKAQGRCLRIFLNAFSSDTNRMSRHFGARLKMLGTPSNTGLGAISFSSIVCSLVTEGHSISRCDRCHVIFDTTGRMLKIVTDVEPFEVPLGVSARLYARLEKVLSEK